MECLTHFGSQSGLLWGYQLKCDERKRYNSVKLQITLESEDPNIFSLTACKQLTFNDLKFPTNTLQWGVFLYKLQELDYGRSGFKDMSSNAFLIFKIFRRYFNTKRTIYPGDIFNMDAIYRKDRYEG
ncbi:hypothetical protein GQX74_009968 [Glossina fuscipes]|nr:hypothetical protein GQX74_009968 [Glossina fuscipes]